LQQDVDDVSEGGGHMGFFTQQAEQSHERGKGLEGMPGVFGPLKVLVACQKQSGYGIPCQHLHNPHCNSMLCSSCAVLGLPAIPVSRYAVPHYTTDSMLGNPILYCADVSRLVTCIDVCQNNTEQTSSTVRRCFSIAEKQGREYSSCGTQNATKFVQAHQQAHHEGSACLWCNKLHFFEQPASSNVKCPGEGSTWLNKMCLFL